MSRDVIRILCAMDAGNVEFQLALQCAPLITGLKISNLLLVQKRQVYKLWKVLGQDRFSRYVLYTDKEKVVNISAVVKPTFSTYKTVKWSTDAALDAICDFNVLNNNKAQVRLNNSGNVGRGIITATTQDGKSASCLVTVIYESDDKEDCIDLRYHEDQQI